MAGRVRLQDLAEATGVTVGTVSAALNGTGRVSDRRRRQIRRLADEMGYHPHVGAQLLKAKTQTDVALIVSEEPRRLVGSGMFAPLITCFWGQCDLANVRGRLEVVDPVQQPEQVPQLLAGGLAGGALLAGAPGPGLRQWLADHPEFPTVAIEEPAEFTVGTAMDRGIEQAAQYLAAMGHRRIALGVGPTVYDVHARLRAGFLRAAALYRLDCDRPGWIEELNLRHHTDAMRASAAWAARILGAEPRPTAIIATDMRAARAVVGVALERGLAIPKDLSVIGVGAGWEAEMSWPLLTAVEWASAAQMAAAVDLLQRRLNGRKIPAANIRVEPLFVVRDSTGHCRGTK